jgi:hypothetical protein
MNCPGGLEFQKNATICRVWLIAQLIEKAEVYAADSGGNVLFVKTLQFDAATYEEQHITFTYRFRQNVILCCAVIFN